MEEKQENGRECYPGVGLTDADILEVMKSVPSYLDISPGDFRELYCLAYRHAVETFARSVLVADIMTTNVVTLTVDMSIQDIVQRMSENGVSGIPVVDSDRRVVGIVSEKDVLCELLGEDCGSVMAFFARCLSAHGRIDLRVRNVTAAEIMTTPVITLRSNMPLFEAADMLTQRGINRLPVVDAEGRLQGILTRTDVVSATTKAGTCSWNS